LAHLEEKLDMLLSGSLYRPLLTTISHHFLRVMF
jgi:hypothetical protein